MDHKDYADPVQGETVRYDWAKGEVTIKDLPKREDFMMALQSHLRRVLDELLRPELTKAG